MLPRSFKISLDKLKGISSSLSSLTTRKLRPRELEVLETQMANFHHQLTQNDLEEFNTMLAKTKTNLNRTNDKRSTRKTNKLKRLKNPRWWPQTTAPSTAGPPTGDRTPVGHPLTVEDMDSFMPPGTAMGTGDIMNTVTNPHMTPTFTTPHPPFPLSIQREDVTTISAPTPKPWQVFATEGDSCPTEIPLRSTRPNRHFRRKENHPRKKREGIH